MRDRHNSSGGCYFWLAAPFVVLPGLFPERRTGTLETGIRVRAGGGAWVFGGDSSVSWTDDKAEWLVEWGGEVGLELMGILDSRGRLVLPLTERKEEDDEEDGGVAWEVGLSLHSDDGEGVLFSS